MQNYGYQLTKHEKLWVLLWKNVAELTRRVKDMQKFFDDSLRFEKKAYLHQGIMDDGCSFHHF